MNFLALQPILFQTISALFLGCLILLTLKVSKSNIQPDPFFHKTLILLPLIIMGIIYFVGSSLTLSIGLIGSLSIVRFRTAIKSSFELLLLLWCILAGIGIGSGKFNEVFFISFAISISIIILERLNLVKGNKNKEDLYLVIETSDTDLSLIEEVLNSIDKNHKMSTIRSNKNSASYSYFLFPEISHSKVISKFDNIEGITSINLSKNA